MFDRSQGRLLLAREHLRRDEELEPEVFEVDGHQVSLKDSFTLVSLLSKVPIVGSPYSCVDQPNSLIVDFIMFFLA